MEGRREDLQTSPKSKNERIEMKVTEQQLRQIIRDELINEGLLDSIVDLGKGALDKLGDVLGFDTGSVEFSQEQKNAFGKKFSITPSGPTSETLMNGLDNRNLHRRLIASTGARKDTARVVILFRVPG